MLNNYLKNKIRLLNKKLYFIYVKVKNSYKFILYKFFLNISRTSN